MWPGKNELSRPITFRIGKDRLKKKKKGRTDGPRETKEKGRLPPKELPIVPVT